jgi:hypothetical protein
MSHQLRQAARQGDLAKVKDQLAKGADVNAPHNYSGWTALSEAANAGHADVVKVLLDHGADMNWRDRGMGITALGYAAAQNHAAVVELLLKHGAELELGNEYNVTPLMSAAGSGHAPIVQMLLAAGADVNACTTAGATSLEFAKINKHAQVVKILQSAGGKGAAKQPKPTVIAWPKVDQTLKYVDHSQPESVLYSFIFAMNRWEKAAAKAKASHAVIDKQMQALFDRFCTKKKRPYGRAGSYSTPPEYNPKTESLLAIDMASASRAELTTRKKDEEWLYVFLKKKGGWLLDSRKYRPVGGKWMNYYL